MGLELFVAFDNSDRAAEVLVLDARLLNGLRQPTFTERIRRWLGL
jgi:hypothetical protein